MTEGVFISFNLSMSIAINITEEPDSPVSATAAPVQGLKFCDYTVSHRITNIFSRHILV